jgi:hypothetical protein
LEKIGPMFWKVSKTVANPKNPKYLHQKFIWNLKTSTSNHFGMTKYPNQTMFWNCLFRCKCKKFPQAKQSQNFGISLGYLSFQKIPMRIPNVAQLAKNAQAGHPCRA